MAVPKDWKIRFLQTLRETANVRTSCEKAGISRRGAYKAREKSEAFASDWDDAIEDAVDKLELAAWARALNGVERRKPIYFKVKDRLTGAEEVIKVDEVVEREYADGLLTLLLKAHKPEKYREHYEVKNTGVTKILVEYVDYSDQAKNGETGDD